MSSTASNIPHYTGYIVDRLPDYPEVGVYLCGGKLQKWLPSGWIIIEHPCKFVFDDLHTGQSHLIGPKGKCKKPCKPKCHEKNRCEETRGTEGKVDVIVRVTILCDERIIRIPIIGKCPEINRFSEIRPIAIENGFFILDVSTLRDNTAVVLSYKSIGSIIIVNHIIERRRRFPICPTFF
jgi:hypothetical protein